MTQGVANPCHFMHSGRRIRGVVHGDDFLFTGTRAQLQWLREAFESEYACKVDLIGFGKNVPNSARFLNRVVSFTEGGIEFEPDQRLIEAIVDGLGLRDSKTCTAPGSAPTTPQREPTLT